jgi:hypothetical protein
MSKTSGYEGSSSPLLDVVPPEVLSDDVPGVLAVMADMEPQLAAAGLPQVVEFNRVYRTLTNTVWEQVNTPGGFKEPDSVVHTVPIFADLYFRQVRAHANGEPEAVDPVWAQLLYDTAPQRRLPGTQFLAGMNAHIRYDLAQALNTSSVGDSYYEDYRKVIGILIDQTAQQLSADYIPGPAIARKAITKGAVIAIAGWREQAWHDGMALQEADNGQTQAVLERLNRTSLRSGRWILGLGNMALGTLTHFVGNRRLPEGGGPESLSDPEFP